MSNEVVIKEILQPFSTVEFEGKVFDIYGDLQNPLFLAKDVAEWIEYSFKDRRKTSRDVSKMLRSIDEDEKLKRTLYVSGQRREVWLLTEKGLKVLLANARNLKAKQILENIENSYVLKNTPKEIKFHSLLEESIGIVKKYFPERSPIEKSTFLGLLTQHRIGSYKVDFFFPNANLIVEYDEHAHKYQEEEDLKREEWIRSEIGADIIRVSEGCEVQGIVEITTYLTKKFSCNGGERE